MGVVESIQAWLPGLLEASLRVSVVIGLVLLVRGIGQRRGAVTWTTWLWALVLVRILIPSLPSSPLSVFNLWTLTHPEARRLACDTMVLSLLSEQESTDYGSTLMDLSTGWARLGTLPSIAGIVENRSLLKWK